MLNKETLLLLFNKYFDRFLNFSTDALKLKLWIKTLTMEIDLVVSLEPEISEVSNYDPGESNVCVSQFLVENDFETRSFLHHSTLMHKFKDFVDQNNFVDVKLVGSDSQVNWI